MNEAQSLLTLLIEHLWGREIPDYFVMLGFVMLATLAVSFLLTRKLSVDRPSLGQQMIELLTENVAKLLEDVIGHNGQKYLPVIGTFAVLILFSNLLGLIPGFMPPTGSILVTAALALCSFLTYNLIGIRNQGAAYIKHFMGPMLPLAVLFFPIEIVSHIARPLSLSIRLFGNIFGDHQVSGVFIHLVPILVPVPFILLGILVSVIQTLVFSLLSMIYIAEAVEHH